MSDGAKNDAGGSTVTQAGGAEGGEKKADAAAVQTSGNGAGEGGSAVTQAGGEKKAEPTAEQKALEAAVDEKWAPKLSDNQKLDDATLGEFRKLAKDAGLKAGQAQKLVEFDLQRQAAAEKASSEHFTKQRQEWRASLKTDPEFGGANETKSIANVARAITKYGTPSLRKFLDAGAGDHPEIVKLFARLGADLAEDPGVKAPARNTAASEDGELRKMFDKSPELFT